MIPCFPLCIKCGGTAEGNVGEKNGILVATVRCKSCGRKETVTAFADNPAATELVSTLRKKWMDAA